MAVIDMILIPAENLKIKGNISIGIKSIKFVRLLTKDEGNEYSKIMHPIANKINKYEYIGL